MTTAARRSRRDGPGELGELLVAWRKRLRPADVGFVAGSNRKVQGLRREEVAVLANVSTDYVERLEQGRSVNPSSEILETLARVLQLSRAERNHLFRVAGFAAAAELHVPQYLSPGTQRMMNRLDNPVAAFDAAWTFITGNSTWLALFGDAEVGRGKHGRNLAWLQFTGQLMGLRLEADEQRAFESALVSDLRAAAATYPRDPLLADLVKSLRGSSETFARIWAAGTVVAHTSDVKTIDHPLVGSIALDCDVLHLPEGGTHLVVYTARPDSEDQERLRLAVTLGQQFSGSHD